MGNLKRRLPGHSSLSSGVTDRSDSSPGPGVSDDVTSNSGEACTPVLSYRNSKVSSRFGTLS